MMASGGSPCSEGDLSPLIFRTQELVQRGPSWSPDGTLVAFAYDMHIYVVDHLGQSLRDPVGQRADRYDGVDFSPFVSPDGESIVFTTLRHGQEWIWEDPRNPEVARSSLDGTNYQRVTRDRYGDMNPAWSPDRESIAFVSTRPLETPRGRISARVRHLGYGNVFIIEPGGDNLRAVSQPVGATKDRPVWSPDSRAVAFLAMEPHTGSDQGLRRVLYVVNADGTGLTRISETESRATWSPDGTKLAFAISKDQSLDVYTTNSDGSNRRRITDHQHGGFSNISSLSWSRDDSMIRFVATRGCRQNNLVQMTSARIWQIARKDAAFLAYRVATPRHCLKSRNEFSTKCRSLYSARS